MLYSVIGTRPQYVKVKPVYDYCLRNNIPHTIVDTNQHYSIGMSDSIIKSLNINNVFSLGVGTGKELPFMSSLITTLYKYFEHKQDAKILVYGDTNSTFCAALVGYKLGLSVGHVEAGARCFNKALPEEINRIFTDSVSDFCFCFSDTDLQNIENGILCGDLEYELLNNLNVPSPSFTGAAVLTVHRKENLSKDNLSVILDLCKQLEYPILWPIHHSVQNVSFFQELNIPENIWVVPPYDYKKMVDALNSAQFIVSDSGGLVKTAPFFGKRILILRKKIERVEVIQQGYGRLATFSKEDIDWLLETAEPNRNFFIYNNVVPSECIVQNFLKDYL